LYNQLLELTNLYNRPTDILLLGFVASSWGAYDFSRSDYVFFFLNKKGTAYFIDIKENTV
jgi:hypothetical protein